MSVNLTTGNVVASFSSPTVASVGGPLGVSYAYNSQGSPSAGLAGEYFNDPGATRDFTGKSASVSRIDPQVGFEWGQGSPNPAVAPDNFLARWSGTLTAPAGTYNFGTISDDGVRVWVDNVKVIDRWTDQGASTAPVYGLPSNLNGGPVPITVEYYEATGAASVSLWQSGLGTPSPVPAAWLSTAVPALPDGWSLSPDPGGDLAYTSARMGARSVTLMDSSGATHPFTWKGNAWASPAGEDTILTNDAGLGTLVAQVPGGSTYAFNANGTLASVASPASSITAGVDGRRSIIRYNWSGSPTRLTSITDQVSNRSITLSYGSPCPANLLCTVDLSAFGAGVEQLSYVANHLSSIVDPGGAKTSFGYDTSGRLATVADVLTNDLVNPVPPERMTTIAYSTDAKAASVTPPAAAAGAPRPKRSYAYTTGAPATTSVRVGDVPATPLLVRTVTLDGVGRLAEDRNGAGEATTYDWGTGDVLRKRTDPLGRVSTTVYDRAGRPTDTYGPGLASEFNGYTSSSAPHASVAYDEGMVGLGATYFSNKSLAEDPVGVGTGVGNPTGALDQNWSAGAPAPVPAANGGDNWSARFTGEIDLPGSGTYQFRVASSDGARVFIDDARVVDAWYDHDGLSTSGSVAVTVPLAGQNPVADSRHRIRVELYEATGNASVRLEWSPPSAGGVFSVVPGTSLFPRYGLTTTSTDADNKAVKTEYADAGQGLGPEQGLATAIVADPAGAALRSTTTYQTTSAGYHRRSSRTLPKGAATAVSYAYYGDSEMVDNPCTTGADLANQAGAVRLSTGADPAGPQGRIVHESVYDGAGRVVATRVATDATWSCTTYDARSRPTSTVDSAGKKTDLSYATPGQVSTSGPDSAGAQRTTVAAVDWAGRPASYTDEAGTTTTTAYDAYGRPQQSLRAFAGGGAATVLTEVALYDAASRVKTFKDYASGAARTHSFDYFADGAVKTTTRANAVVTTATNDDNNRGWVKALSNVGPLGELSPWTYARSPAARVTTETTTNRSRVFAYDGVGRLATTTEGATVRPYAYDANSNRCSVTQATCDGSWTYDDADRLLTSPYASANSYDMHGNLSAATPTAAASPVVSETIAYDGADHATVINDGATITTETLGPSGRVLRRQVVQVVGLVQIEDTTFSYSGPGDSPAYSWATGLLPLTRTTNVVGPSGLLLVDSGVAGLATYPITNGHGDIVGTTDNLGLYTANPVTDEFGRGEPASNRLGWLGNHQRYSTGAALHLVRMGVRLYDPNLGRFLQVDPVEGGLDTNDYAYVKDPVNEFDLDGNGFCAAGHNPKNGRKHGGCRGGKVARTGARIGVGLAAGAAGGALAGSFCAATAGAGCFILAGVAGRMLVGTTAQLTFDAAMDNDISTGSALGTLAGNVVGGGNAGLIRGATGRSGLNWAARRFTGAPGSPGFRGLLRRGFWG